jgi:hypothetical protein
MEVDNGGMNRLPPASVRQDGAMVNASPNYVSHEPVGSLGEFFEGIEREDGPTLTEEDHRLIVETIRSDRDRDD